MNPVHSSEMPSSTTNCFTRLQSALVSPAISLSFKEERWSKKDSGTSNAFLLTGIAVMRTFPILGSRCTYPDKYVDNHPAGCTGQLEDVSKHGYKPTQYRVDPCTGQLSGRLRLHEGLPHYAKDCDPKRPEIRSRGRTTTKNRPMVFHNILLPREEQNVRGSFTVFTNPFV